MNNANFSQAPTYSRTHSTFRYISSLATDRKAQFLHWFVCIACYSSYANEILSLAKGTVVVKVSTIDTQAVDVWQPRSKRNACPEQIASYDSLVRSMTGGWIDISDRHQFHPISLSPVLLYSSQECKTHQLHISHSE